MTDPVLHLVAGPNGSGKTTFVERLLAPVTHLPFVNADLIAAERWPEDPLVHAYEAARLAEAERRRLLAARSSFLAETVFSHPSKVDLCRAAVAAGYLVTLHVLLIPEALAVARVAERVRAGGHDVPEEKTRQRYRRLWPLIRQAIAIVAAADVLDNSRAATPFRRVARFEKGQLLSADWPPWTPAELRTDS